MMNRLTKTLLSGSLLGLCAAGQVVFSTGTPTDGQVVFQQAAMVSNDVSGLDCVSKKLLFPKPPPEKPGKLTEHLQNALARYGE